MIKINTIITLENNEKYLVLNLIKYEDNNYYLVVKVNENKELDSKQPAIFKEEIDGNDCYIVKIGDQGLLQTLIDLFKQQF